MKAKKTVLTIATLSAFLALGGTAFGQTGAGSTDRHAESGKKSTRSGKKSTKTRRHRKHRKSKKGSSTTTTPPPK